MKKLYNIPTIEVVQLATGSIMGLASGSGEEHAEMAPPRRDVVF